MDTVEDVGQVFEVEAPARDNCDPDRQILECRRLFGPYLGRDIAGSNEDLAPPVPPHRVQADVRITAETRTQAIPESITING